MPHIRSICGRCRCSTATAGASLDGVAVGRHPCVPAPGAGRGDVRGDRRAPGHASVRRADRHVDAAQRAADDSGRASPPGRVRRPPAAPPPAAVFERHGGRRLQGHARLRPDGGLWPGRGLRMAGGMGRARRRRARPAEGAPGRALHRSGRADGSATRRPCSRCPRTA